MTDKIEIYVACLASYNDGILHGRWIDATQDVADIRKEISGILQSSPILGAEEYAIHDYDGFGSLRLGEYASIERVQAYARWIEEHGDLAIELIDNYGGDMDEVRRVLMFGGYTGPFDSIADYAREYVDEYRDLPDWIVPFIDYDMLGRDLVLSGSIDAIEVGNQVYIVFDP